MAKDSAPKAFTAPLEAETESQLPPDMVATVAVKASDPPPEFETESVCDDAVAPSTNENVKELGFALRLGAPGAVAVSFTGMACEEGFAAAAVIVSVPEFDPAESLEGSAVIWSEAGIVPLEGETCNQFAEPVDTVNGIPGIDPITSTF